LGRISSWSYIERIGAQKAYGLSPLIAPCQLFANEDQYHVSIAPEMNYAIMAALTAVLDDLRTDEGC
jgi:hypothetical protein